MIGKDGMTLLFVPNGDFIMGSGNGDSDEKPIHTVDLDAFWIDKTEVTNAMYEECVQDRVCKLPSSTKSYARDSYYGNSEFDNHPVIYVSWEDAKAYCAWTSRRLPTEAEWEKAARGTEGRTYPWGKDAPNFHLLNYDRNVEDTTEVGKYPNGASPYGALDMAGNVAEWVKDWYDETYYNNSPLSNPKGPILLSGLYRVRRGGSWSDDGNDIHSSARDRYLPNVTVSYVGFRCAKSATP